MESSELGHTEMYAVRIGRQPGVYSSWSECQQQVHRYQGAEFKSFPTQAAAAAFCHGAARGRAAGVAAALRPPAQRFKAERPRQWGGWAAPQGAPAGVHARCLSEAVAHAESWDDGALSDGDACAGGAAARGVGGRSLTECWVFFDGGSRGNPGPAGCGACVFDSAPGGGARVHPVATRAAFLGRATNNVAEYEGLILGLTLAIELGASVVHIRGDSSLVINQMTGQWKVKNAKLGELLDVVKTTLLPRFLTWHAQHVYRNENSVADALANEAMDGPAHIQLPSDQASQLR